MSDEAKLARRRRRLSAEERTLWTVVTGSIKPLRPDMPESPVAPPVVVPVAAKRPTRLHVRIGSAAVPPPPPKPLLQPAASLSRKEKKRVARGVNAIDGRLDLHGLTQAEAHAALFGFLAQAQTRGAKLVLVITGKGGDDPYSGRGVLKRQVPLWLRLPEFQDCVIGFEAASIGHGGEGALYVRVRRLRG